MAVQLQMKSLNRIMIQMRQAEIPSFHSDRSPVKVLEKNNPAIFSRLQSADGAIDPRYNNIQFCGLLHDNETGSHMFLPRTSLSSSNEKENLEIAKLTMRALARYGSETSRNGVEDDAENGNTELLGIIRRLGDDFRENGLFMERRRTKTRNSGKTDWTLTVKRELGVPNLKGQPVFSNLRSTRPVRSQNALLTQIQAAVLREIFQIHGWWMGRGFSSKSQLVTCPQPPFSRSVWDRKLAVILPTLFSARSIRLAEYLRAYLRCEANSKKGTSMFGLSDFHNVWEAMLRETITRSSIDKRLSWNSLLPKPHYILKTGRKTVPMRGMQTDIIIQTSVSDFTIVDAKYYTATSVDNAPSWRDIGKQMIYETALTDAVETRLGTKPNVKNVFAFPSKSGVGPFEKVEMRFDGEHITSSSKFNEIDCIYISVKSVLASYVKKQQNINIMT